MWIGWVSSSTIVRRGAWCRSLASCRNEAKQAYFKRIEDLGLRNPRMVGFGISNRQTFDAACAHASGAIIGSQFVSLLNEGNGCADQAIQTLKQAIYAPE